MFWNIVTVGVGWERSSYGRVRSRPISKGFPCCKARSRRVVSSASWHRITITAGWPSVCTSGTSTRPPASRVWTLSPHATASPIFIRICRRDYSLGKDGCPNKKALSLLTLGSCTCSALIQRNLSPPGSRSSCCRSSSKNNRITHNGKTIPRWLPPRPDFEAFLSQQEWLSWKRFGCFAQDNDT